VKIPRDLRPAAKQARKAGWTLSLTRGGHLAWHSPAGRTVFCPATPSDRRSVANVIGKLRRKGLKLR
jgi:predicted RNA binding protein YcfA (HicA-like mRNA interferase family)